VQVPLGQPQVHVAPAIAADAIYVVASSSSIGLGGSYQIVRIAR
jgi:hypothetical protein